MNKIGKSVVEDDSELNFDIPENKDIKAIAVPIGPSSSIQSLQKRIDVAVSLGKELDV